MVVFLIGYMGCGKSSIGKKIAGYLNWKFVDMDDIIESRMNISISEIFATKGEQWFREQESELLKEFAEDDNVIVATGGGVPCFKDNMEVMDSIGHTIYLNVSPENLFVRLKRGREHRPKIKDLNDVELMEFVKRTLSPREQFYDKASLLINCNGVDEEYIAAHIERHLKHKIFNI